MLTHSSTLWRIEYRTDLTRAREPVLPVGFVLEAHWNNDVRWLGMLFRKRLMPLELDRVNLETWPEMNDLETFMNGLFDKVWDQKVGGRHNPPRLGSALVAPNYAMHSSLHFASDEPKVKLSTEDAETSFSALYVRLLGLHGSLSPTLTAPVVRLPKKSKPASVVKPVRADVEQVLRAA
jgi:hypothetical protein